MRPDPGAGCLHLASNPAMSDRTIRPAATATPTISSACTKCGAMTATLATACAVCGAAVTGGVAASAEQGDRMMARIQEKIGDRFRLLELLGRGGMGIVFRALETALDREVALKVLAIDPLFDPDAYARFEREAKLAARLDHPGIVPIFAVGAHDSVAYYTMRLVRGGSIEDMLEGRRSLDMQQILGILRDVAGALDHAHKSGVVHRDIKPANILLSETGHACVADFGIAKALGRQDGTTGTGVIGSPAYMSPEQWRGEGTIDGRADQYALAVVAFELITGRRPFISQSPQELLVQHCTGEIPDIMVLRPGLDPSIGEAIARAMSKRSSERFGSVTAFVESLAGRRPVAADTSTRSLRVPRYQPPPPPPRRWRKVAFMLALGAALAGGWFAPQTAPIVRPVVRQWSAIGMGYVEVILSGLRPAPAVPDDDGMPDAAPEPALASADTAVQDSTTIAADSALQRQALLPDPALDPVRDIASLERPPIGPASEPFRPVARDGYIRVVVRGGAAPVILNGERAGVSAGPGGQVIRAGPGTHYITVPGAGDLFMPSQIAVTVTTGDTAVAVFSAATRRAPVIPPATPPDSVTTASAPTASGPTPDSAGRP